jgi:hypothetical protein
MRSQILGNSPTMNDRLYAKKQTDGKHTKKNNDFRAPMDVSPLDVYSFTIILTVARKKLRHLFKAKAITTSADPYSICVTSQLLQFAL